MKNNLLLKWAGIGMLSFLLMIYYSCDIYEMDKSNDFHTGILKNFTGLDGCGWIIQLSDSSKLEPINLDEFKIDLEEGKKVEIKYHERNDLGSICMVGKIVEIDSIKGVDKKEYGFVTFGANYHIINCLSTVTVYLDGFNIGTLQNPTDTIKECGQPENITKEISTGKHYYKVEIRPKIGTGCLKDIFGTFEIEENECEKVFIDYRTIWDNISDCEQDVVISPDEYKNAPNDPFSIKNMVIDGDCLKITYEAGGCDGSTWLVKLIDSGAVAESYPCQRTLRLSMDNKEVCDAVISKTTSFDIKDLQIVGNDKVLLRVSGEEILYEY
ncbi:MAG: hypothetical protein ABFS35_18710 [Bacteroidota bacterium]